MKMKNVFTNPLNTGTHDIVSSPCHRNHHDAETCLQTRPTCFIKIIYGYVDTILRKFVYIVGHFVSRSFFISMFKSGSKVITNSIRMHIALNKTFPFKSRWKIQRRSSSGIGLLLVGHKFRSTRARISRSVCYLALNLFEFMSHKGVDSYCSFCN